MLQAAKSGYTMKAYRWSVLQGHLANSLWNLNRPPSRVTLERTFGYVLASQRCLGQLEVRLDYLA